MRDQFSRVIIFPTLNSSIFWKPWLTINRVLSVTYVAIPCAISVCYWRHISPYLVLSLCAISDICHHTLCYLCVLWATYIAIPCAISVCYWQHISPYLVLSLCAMGDICRHSFISLNFAGLLSTTTRISTQLLMTSCGKKDGVNIAAFNLFTAIWVQIQSSIYLRYYFISFYQF